MERELWLELYRMLLSIGNTGPIKRARFTDLAIAAVYAWAVVHDRATSWAADARNWPADLLAGHFPAGLPHQSTLSRRLRRAGGAIAALLAAVHAELAGGDGSGDLVKVIDSKPLPVGAYSRARDATWGHAVKGLARGYKLHALWGGGPVPIAFEVVPMSGSEQRVAKRLFAGHLHGGGYVLADSVYDVNDLYPRAAAAGHQLVARRKVPGGNVGARARHPGRLRAIDMLEGPCGAFGRELYAVRTTIERDFGHLTNFGGGLAPLPNWVRTLPRVRLWVQTKLLISGVRQRLRQRAAAEPAAKAA